MEHDTNERKKKGVGCSAWLAFVYNVCAERRAVQFRRAGVFVWLAGWQLESEKKRKEKKKQTIQTYPVTKIVLVAILIVVEWTQVEEEERGER